MELNDCLLDKTASNDGVWKKLDGYDAEVKLRSPFSDAYLAAEYSEITVAQRRAEQSLTGLDIVAARQRAVVRGALVDFRGFTAGGQPVKFSQAKAIEIFITNEYVAPGATQTLAAALYDAFTEHKEYLAKNQASREKNLKAVSVGN